LKDHSHFFGKTQLGTFSCN